MWGLLLVGLLIVLVELLAALWPLLLVAAVGFVFGCLLVRPRSAAAQREAREALRHERARREIDRIALETSRAMYEAASARADAIEGTAVEIEPR